MEMQSLSELTRSLINSIGSGDVGYLNKPVSHAIAVLDRIAAQEELPETLRKEAAYAAANLVLAEVDES